MSNFAKVQHRTVLRRSAVHHSAGGTDACLWQIPREILRTLYSFKAIFTWFYMAATYQLRRLKWEWYNYLYIGAATLWLGPVFRLNHAIFAVPLENQSCYCQMCSVSVQRLSFCSSPTSLRLQINRSMCNQKEDQPV